MSKIERQLSCGNKDMILLHLMASISAYFEINQVLFFNFPDYLIPEQPYLNSDFSR
jgi:hypothetical protein